MRSRFGGRVFAASLALMLCQTSYAQNNGPKPLPPAEIKGKVATETEIVTSKNTSPMLSVSSADALREVISRYTQIDAEGGFPKVPKGTYKKGAESQNVAALNRRLFMDGYVRKEAVGPEFVNRVTSATMDGVLRFQRNMGLAATGLVDGPTLAALNVPVADRIRTMQANIPRLESYAQDLGDRYLVVNVPSQQIETVSDGRVFSRHNAIVGRPERPTPVVMTALSDINFNPYWNAPASIVENDIIPKLRSGTSLLTEMDMRVFQGFGGPEVDPKKVNWRNAVADNYHFRQEPGPKSAMATAKINFSSPFGIYLHDTPEKHLFNSGERLFSSGCVRVEKVDLLMEWVLNGQDGIDGSQIAALAETLERRDVKLTTPPQLRVTYLTAWPVGKSVAFRRDVYGLDGTGFTVGQPLPQGEVSDDGQRFVLKPVPRKPAAVDADEAEGFGLFGSRLRKPGKQPQSTNFFDREAESSGGGDFIIKKPVSGSKKRATVSKTKVVSKSGDTKKLDGKKPRAGFFDWAAYRKDQKQSVKTPAKKVEKATKKKTNIKKVETAAVVVPPKEKAKPGKEKSLDADVSAKKLDDKATKKVAAANPGDVKKTTAPVTQKKPADEVKKAADTCKSDKNCKVQPVKKPDVKKVDAKP